MLSAAEPGKGAPTWRRGRGLTRAWWGLVLIFAVLLAWTWQHYGATWDEFAHSTYGERIVRYLLSGAADQRARELSNLHYYGGLVDALGAAVTLGWARLTGSGIRPWRPGEFTVPHLLFAWCALLTAVAVGCFARRWRRGALVAALAVLALCCLPRWFGHACNNPKDIPFAAGFALAMAAMLALTQAERPGWRHWLGFGAAAGFALAVRTGGFLLLPFLAAALALRWRRRAERRAWLRDWRRQALMAATALLLMWVIMIALWPWAHANPLLNPIRAFLFASRFPDPIGVRFAGQVLDSQSIPRAYLLHYLAVTLPLPMLLLIPLGVGRLGWQCRYGPEPARRRAALLLLWLLFPVAWLTVTRAPLYNGVRHVLFIFPAMAVTVAVGLAWLVGRAPRRWRRAAVVGAALLLLWPVPKMIHLHPYESSYYNALVGGLAGAADGYEVDYWNSACKAAGEWLSTNAQSRPGRQQVVVWWPVHAEAVHCVAYYLEPPERFHVHIFGSHRPPGPRPDYVVLPFGKLEEAGGRLPDWPRVFTVERDGVVLCAVLRAPPPTTQ